MLRMYFLLDAASVDSRLREVQACNPDHRSLYKGDSARDLAAVAPYLFLCDAASKFLHMVQTEGWGKSWGVFCAAEADLAALQQHFRKFLIVKDERGRPLYFRYYDPRVLRTVLPVLDAGQIEEFFGPVKYFILEDADPGFSLRFTIRQGHLRQDRAKITAADPLAAFPDAGA